MSQDLFGGITEGLTFDSSLSETLDKSLSPDEYKGRIINHLEPILKKRFPNHLAKQRIHPHTDRKHLLYCLGVHRLQTVRREQENRDEIIHSQKCNLS